MKAPKGWNIRRGYFTKTVAKHPKNALKIFQYHNGKFGVIFDAQLASGYNTVEAAVNAVGVKVLEHITQAREDWSETPLAGFTVKGVSHDIAAEKLTIISKYGVLNDDCSRVENWLLSEVATKLHDAGYIDEAQALTERIKRG